MAVPRNRLSNQRKKQRRAHNALSAKSLTTCAHCGAAKQPHRACPSCGVYRGRAVVSVEATEAAE